MDSVKPNFLYVLQLYVGKIFYHEYHEIEVIDLLGGLADEPFFLCRMVWNNYVYCATPMDIVTMFDENLEPYDDYNVADVQ